MKKLFTLIMLLSILPAKAMDTTSRNTIIGSIGIAGILYGAYKLFFFNVPQDPHPLQSYCPKTVKNNKIPHDNSKIAPEVAPNYCGQCMDEYFKILANDHNKLIIESEREKLAAKVYENHLGINILDRIPNLTQKSVPTSDSSIAQFFFPRKEIPAILTEKQETISDLQKTINDTFLVTSLIKQLNQKAQSTLENVNKVKIEVPQSLENSLATLSSRFKNSDAQRKVAEQAILNAVRKANKNMHQYHGDIQKFTQSLHNSAQGLNDNANIYRNTIIPGLRNVQRPLNQTIENMRIAGDEIRDIANQGNQMVNRLNGVSEQARVNRRDLNRLRVDLNNFIQNDPPPAYPGR